MTPDTHGYHARKTDSLRRLEDSALLLFSRKGYDGTALRDIADAAGVPLSLIDRHFGTKAQFFDEIHMRVWRALNRERTELLANFRCAKGESPLGLDSVVRAFVQPVVVMAHSSAQGRAAMQLVREARRLLFHRNHFYNAERDAVREIWINAFMTARPALARPDAVWAFALVVNALYSNQLLDEWLNHLMEGAPSLDATGVTERIVAFCAAGVDALARQGNAKTSCADADALS